MRRLQKAHLLKYCNIVLYLDTLKCYNFRLSKVGKQMF